MTPCPPLAPVIGHRGAAARAPENTLAGLRRAKDLGCSWVEFDVRLTGDGALVLCHDARLDRTTTGQGRVSAHRLSAIRCFDAGAWFAPEFAGGAVPTLEEALLVAAELGLSVNIEIKADRGQGRSVLFRVVPGRWRTIAARLGCATINTDHRRLSRWLAAEIRDAGYPLLVYTVNDPQRARTLFEWGVTSVFSDVPDIILPVSSVEPPLRHSAAGATSSLGMRQGANW